MSVTLQVGNASLGTFTIEAETHEELFEQAGFFQSLPGVCPVCGEGLTMNAIPGKTTDQKTGKDKPFTAYKLSCMGTPMHSSTLGSGERGLFYKPNEEWYTHAVRSGGGQKAATKAKDAHYDEEAVSPEVVKSSKGAGGGASGASSGNADDAKARAAAMKNMLDAFKTAGVAHADRIAVASWILGTDLGSFADLTRDDADEVGMFLEGNSDDWKQALV